MVFSSVVPNAAAACSVAAAVRQGHGVATEADGSRYEGEWAEDLRSGEGSATDAPGGWRYTGQWLRGRRVGQGQLVGPAEREYTGGFDEQALP